MIHSQKNPCSILLSPYSEPPTTLKRNPYYPKRLEKIYKTLAKPLKALVDRLEPVMVADDAQSVPAPRRC